MRIIADLHPHSRFSRACSKALTLPHLEKWARIKGIQLLGTGDCLHPQWLKEIQEQLEDLGNGLFQLRTNLREKDSPVNLVKNGQAPKFVLSTEVSCIYRKLEKTRRLHILIIFSGLPAVVKLQQHLNRKYNIHSDGRPILGLDAKELAALVWQFDQEALVIPAHIWTPWFSLFGSKSGFDRLEECFEEYSEKIYAIETGLSSDPPMNWRLSQLDRLTVLSHSDAHSGANLGREADVFDWPADFGYQDLYQTVKNKDLKKLLYTIEFFPEEGMYHYDGHRQCQVCWSPEETTKHKGVCPQCGRPVTVGVMSRVRQLADRAPGAKPEAMIPYKSLVPLPEIIASAFGQDKKTKKVAAEYLALIRAFGSEFEILLDLPLEEIGKIAQPLVVTGIKRVRAGRLTVEPGYDGVYGTVKIFQPEERPTKKIKQKKLF